MNQPTRAAAQIKQRRSPTPALPQEEQQKVGEVELLFDGERPENSVDAVAGVRVEIVKHQQVHHHVVDKKVRDVDARRKRRHQQEQSERDQVGRIEPAKAAPPKSAKAESIVVVRSLATWPTAGECRIRR